MLFLIQDTESPMFVLAGNWSEAITKWRRFIIADSEGQVSMDDPPNPQGVQLLAEDDEIIL